MLTAQRSYSLLVDLEKFDQSYRYAEYSTFNVDSSLNKYRLTIGGYQIRINFFGGLRTDACKLLCNNRPWAKSQNLPPPPGYFCRPYFFNLTMYQVTFRSSCQIRSDSQTTGLTLTTGAWESFMKRRGASNMNIHYDVTGLLTAVWKVTLRSTCLGCLSWLRRRWVVYS